MTINRLNLLWGTTPIRCPKVNSTEALVDVAESLLEQQGYVRAHEVIAIVAGTRTKSGSTNFLRLHVMGEHNLEGLRFFTSNEEATTIVAKPAPVVAEAAPVSAAVAVAKPKRVAAKPTPIKTVKTAKATKVVKGAKAPARKK